MQDIKYQLVRLCKDFIKTAEEAYEKNLITKEELHEMTKMKIEFIHRIEIEYENAENRGSPQK